MYDYTNDNIPEWQGPSFEYAGYIIECAIIFNAGQHIETRTISTYNKVTNNYDNFDFFRIVT